MRVPDTNLLLYAINPDSPCRDAAQQCLNEAAQSSEGMGLTWIGLLVPAGTPKEIVSRMQREIEKIVNLPEIQERLSKARLQAAVYLKDREIGGVFLSRPPVLREPLAVQAALDVVHDWLAHPSVSILQPGARHMDIMSHLLLSAGTAGNLTSDAHLAAIAIEHNAEVLTFDRDFARFTGLRYQLLS